MHSPNQNRSIQGLFVLPLAILASHCRAHPELQEHGLLVNPSASPVTRYDWAFAGAATGNFSRLDKITYPSVGGGLVREVELQYDSGVDDALSRVSRIESSGPQAGSFDVGVDYAYAGVGRRVSATLDNGVSQTFAGSGGYAGLDRFGRVKDLHWAAGASPATVHRYQYGYDAAGNREYARVTQATVGSTSHDNDRSYDYAYDELNRLLLADHGGLNSGNSAIATVARAEDWALDNLGNWAGDESVAGYTRGVDLNADGDVGDTGETVEIEHLVDSGNAITQVAATYSGSTATQEYVHDLNGALVFDGSYWYQYDAWNRLLQIHPAGSLEADDFEADGSLKETAPEPDEWIVRHIYDAMGRLMRKRVPHPGNASKTVTENYFYDGVRRIQTSITWPAQSGWSAGTAWQEYVYGPDYVDEFVAFVDDPLGSGVGTYYTLQDANYNVMALLRASSSDGGPTPLSASNVVVWQAQFSPYGLPLVAETITANLPSSVTATQAAAACRIGHQGLFIDRLDGAADGPSLTADAELLYHNRNRTYSPALGRFVQKDVNGAGLPVLAALAMNGTPIDALLDRFDPQSHYGDGLSLYLYAGADPVNARDPAGLFWGGLPGLLASGGIATGWAFFAADVIETANGFADRALGGADIYSNALDTLIDAIWKFTPASKYIDRAFDTVKAANRTIRSAQVAVDSVENLALRTWKWKTGVDPRVLAEAQQQYPKLKGKTHNHHIIPKYLGGDDAGETVPIDAAYHQLITNAFRDKWAYGQGKKPERARGNTQLRVLAISTATAVVYARTYP
jgi:RHS repeat-associated protein